MSIVQQITNRHLNLKCCVDYIIGNLLFDDTKFIKLIIGTEMDSLLNTARATS